MKDKFRLENFNYGLFPPPIKLYHRNASIENNYIRILLLDQIIGRIIGPKMLAWFFSWSDISIFRLGIFTTQALIIFFTWNSCPKKPLQQYF